MGLSNSLPKTNTSFVHFSAITLTKIVNSNLQSINQYRYKEITANTKSYQESYQKGLEYQYFIQDYVARRYDYTIDFFEDAYTQFLSGETRQGIEIKNDAMIAKTGNVYLEIAEKKKAENESWIESGILNTKYKYFLIGDKKVFYMISRENLMKHFESLKPDSLIFEGKTSVGLLVSVSDFIRMGGREYVVENR
jgi:hypothetical protein